MYPPDPLDLATSTLFSPVVYALLGGDYCLKGDLRGDLSLEMAEGAL
jgi:hypothetical protein